MKDGAAITCPFCQGAGFAGVVTYTEPPECEVRFAVTEGQTYHRELIRCERCGHFLSIHGMDMGDLYAGGYVDANYGDDALRANFDRIINLPVERSDNRGRVKRICDYLKRRLEDGGAGATVLDVGSGLAVFPYAMKQEGWDCTALDPDRRAARHAEEVAGVKAVAGDFMACGNLGRFDLVTFNKVLEHVADPVAMLARSHGHLAPGGTVYVELPDGEMAVRESPYREEFTIDHPHVFSAASMTLLAYRAGFAVQKMERLREPSGKYSLYMFLRDPTQAGAFEKK